jgi:hypothetical protein
MDDQIVYDTGEKKAKEVHGCVYSLELGLLFIQLSGIVI